MNRVNEWIYNVSDEKEMLKRATFWNLVTSIINASMTAVILFFLTISNQSKWMGAFSIASAVAYQCQSIGFFGVRNYHIADVSKKYKFSDYVYVNVFSSILMIGLIVYFSFGKGYEFQKTIIILSYSLYRAVDIIEALYHDEYQRQNRIDIGMFMQTVRFTVSLIVLLVVLIITKSLVFGSFAAAIVSLIIIYFQNKDFSKKFNCSINSFNKINFKELIKICVPICISSFINLYLVNASKYAIDIYSNDITQAYFAVLVIPVFTINLLSTVIYRPYITIISRHWNDNDLKGFVSSISKQLFIIMILTALIILFGYAIGLRILEIIYSMVLNQYMSAFLLLLLGGGLNTIGAFLFYILVIIEEQNKTLVIYIISLLFTFICRKYLIVQYELDGAAWLYILASFIITLVSLIIVVYKYMKRRKEYSL